MRISVRVKANAKEASVEKISENEYAVRVNAPPTEGRANARLVEILSDYFDVPKSSIRITRGLTSKDKTVEIG